jgi:ribosomal-protein-alanine N-acetyltransferase
MNLNILKFRKANEKDISSIMQIEKLSFSSEICENEDIFKERISIFPEGFIIMTYNERVIGYLCSELWKYKYKVEAENFILGHSINKFHNNNGNELYISSMGILPQYRGKGMGRVLFENSLDYILERYKNLKTAVLIVSKKWENAIGIYRKNNFKEILVLNSFFKYHNLQKNYEDGIVMRKYFNKSELI